MKKLTFLTLSLVFVLALSSCGSEEAKSEPKDATVETTETVTEEAAPAEATTEAAAPAAMDLAAGEATYKAKCIACHQATGAGLPGAFPPLAGADYLKADPKGAITIVKKGLQGKITVNGTEYNGMMPPPGVADAEVKDVVNYILNSWGNDYGTITDADVAAVK